MSRHSRGVSRFRLAAAAPALALLVTAVTTVGGETVQAAPQPSPERTSASLADEATYINYAAPQVEPSFGRDVKVSKGKKSADQRGDAIARAMRVDAKHAQGNPVAARELAKLEAKSLKSGKSPKQIKSHNKGAKATQEAKLLTILVEFNENANDDFKNRDGANRVRRHGVQAGGRAERTGAQHAPQPR